MARPFRLTPLLFGAGLAVLALLSGPAPRPAAAQGGRLALPFWHTRRGDQEKLLEALCAEYNAANPGVEVQPQYQGSYDDLLKKVRASILSRSLPALSVAYESHVVEYAANQAVLPLDRLVKDPRLGFSKAELADIPPVYVSSNRFPQYGNQLLSFPFTKSTMVLYYNRTLLRQAGFRKPPATWEEFERQAAALTKRIGQPAYAFDVDPSTLNGLLHAHGGTPLTADGRQSRFDQPPMVRLLERLRRMMEARTLRTIGGSEQAQVFASQRCAFVFSTSAALAPVDELVQSRFEWNVALPPHAAGVKPVTILYGPNVCVFRSTPERERAAWQFIRWFVSPPVTARWSRETGYLPVRGAAVRLPEMQAYYRKNPRALNVYRMLPHARPEPNAVGWQEIRRYLSDAARAATGRGTSAGAIAVELKRKADQALAQSR